MRFRFGVACGLAAGYVLGAKAGTERYEQIRQAADKALGSSTAKDIESGVRDAWSTAKEEFPVVEKVAEQVADQVGAVQDIGERWGAGSSEEISP